MGGRIRGIKERAASHLCGPSNRNTTTIEKPIGNRPARIAAVATMVTLVTASTAVGSTPAVGRCDSAGWDGRESSWPQRFWRWFSRVVSVLRDLDDHPAFMGDPDRLGNHVRGCSTHGPIEERACERHGNVGPDHVASRRARRLGKTEAADHYGSRLGGPAASVGDEPVGRRRQSERGDDATARAERCPPRGETAASPARAVSVAAEITTLWIGDVSSSSSCRGRGRIPGRRFRILSQNNTLEELVFRLRRRLRRTRRSEADVARTSASGRASRSGFG